jgi:hypothetical protein
VLRRNARPLDPATAGPWLTHYSGGAAPYASEGTGESPIRSPAPSAQRPDRKTPREVSMSIHVMFAPIVSLIAGILILVMPRLLNYIVAIYLILIGLLGLFG